MGAQNFVRARRAGTLCRVMHLNVDTATDPVCMQRVYASTRQRATGHLKQGGHPPVPIGAEGPHLSVDTATDPVHAESEASKIAELRN